MENVVTLLIIVDDAITSVSSMPVRFPSSFEEVQAMLVQGSAPELVVVLFVSVAPVHGRTPVAAHELLRGADHHAVAGAKE